MEIRPIRSLEDYEVALREIESLFDAESHTPEGDRLEIWTALVEAYEEKHFPIPEPDPIDAILYYLESRGLSTEDLLPYVGDKKTAQEILNRQRPLSIEIIRNLHTGLGISADILIKNYKIA